MGWKSSGSLPVYQQIACELRERIFDGTYAPGSRLPSVRDVAANVIANPNTVMRAFSELEQEGLITVQSTLGYFITDNGETVRQAKNRAAGKLTDEYWAKMKKLGYRTTQIADFIMDCEKGDDFNGNHSGM